MGLINVLADYRGGLFFFVHSVAKFQLSSKVHVLIDAQVQQQVILLRDIRRHLAEGSRITSASVDL